MRKIIILAVLILPLCFAPGSRAEVLDQSDEDLLVLLYEGVPVSENFGAARKLYLQGEVMPAYDLWLSEGFNGDLRSLAQACVALQNHPNLGWPVPAAFFEGWLIKLLGEGEAAFWLGYAHGRVKPEHNEELQKHYYIRSGLASHFEGQYIASFMFEDFTPYPPPDGPKVNVLPEKYAARYTPGQRYWLPRAADAGNPWAAGLLATIYSNVTPPTKDTQELAVKYFAISRDNGFFPAAAWLAWEYKELYIEGIIQEPFLFNSFLYVAYKRGKIIEAHIDNLLAFLRESPRTKGPVISRAAAKAQVEKAKQAYVEISARVQAHKDAREALFDKARLRLPEMKAEYEKLAAEHREKNQARQARLHPPQPLAEE